MDIETYNERDIEVYSTNKLMTWLRTTSKEQESVVIDYISEPKPGIFQVYLTGKDGEGVPSLTGIYIKSNTYSNWKPLIKQFGGFFGEGMEESITWSELEKRLSLIISKKELDEIVKTIEEFMESEQFKKHIKS